jgi:hypothetical protein
VRTHKHAHARTRARTPVCTRTHARTPACTRTNAHTRAPAPQGYGRATWVWARHDGALHARGAWATRMGTLVLISSIRIHMCMDVHGSLRVGPLSVHVDVSRSPPRQFAGSSRPRPRAAQARFARLPTPQTRTAPAPRGHGRLRRPLTPPPPPRFSRFGPAPGPWRGRGVSNDTADGECAAAAEAGARPRLRMILGYCGCGSYLARRTSRAATGHPHKVQCCDSSGHNAHG